MKDILKWPLLIAAIVVVLRVIVERAGAPVSVTNLLSVVALHTILGPLYFAIRAGRSSQPRPYITLIKLIAIYVVLTRAMILPTYWLARILNWSEPRFAGLGQSESGPLIGFIALPFLTAGFWIVASLVVGTAIGAATIAIMRSRPTIQQAR